MLKLTLCPWICAFALASAIALAPQTAAADEAFALDRLHAAPAGDRMIGVPSPFAAGELGIHAAVIVDYAHNPLVLKGNTDDTDGPALVSNNLSTHVNATVSLFNRFVFNIDLPVVLVQSGDDPGAARPQTFASSRAAEVGDLRVGLRVPITGKYFDALQLAFASYVWLPTGRDEAGSFVSDGTMRALPHFIAGGRLDFIVWSAALGAEARGSRSFDGVTIGSSVWGGAGVAILLGEEQPLQIGAEMSASTVLEDPARRNTNMELLGSARYRFGYFEAGLAGGPGLTGGIGTPDVRILGQIAFTPRQERPSGSYALAAPPDRDNDGIPDASDACPDTPGVSDPDERKNGCAGPTAMDKDGDGIPDAKDACPSEVGGPDRDATRNGCAGPRDRDQDGVVNEIDACPDTPGISSDRVKTNGCPLANEKDKDSDGIEDAVDACPHDTGSAHGDPAKNGCPSPVPQPK
jgi:OOP family OmpA-OmpF porin